MRPSVIALTGAVLLTALGTAILSGPTEPPLARVSPAQSEPEASGYAAAFDPGGWTGTNSGRPLQTRPTATRTTTAPRPTDNFEDAPEPPTASEPRGGAPRPPRTTGTPTEFLSDALFRQLDANRDGVLTGSEIPTEFRTAVNERGHLGADTFSKLFRANVDQLRSEQGATAPLPAWFADLDPQGTGRVSADRWRASGRTGEEFQLIDADGDGFLTPREVRSYLARSAPPASASPAVASNASGSAIGSGKPAAATASGVSEPERATKAPASAPKPPATRADGLLAHYTAVAAGSPAVRGMVASLAPAPAKPALTKAAPAPAPAAQPAPAPPKATSAAPRATLPLPLTGNDYWVRRDIENQLALLTGERPNVLFLGDSITDFLHNASGKPIWDEKFVPLGALDFAVAGITTSEVLWQIETGQVAMAAPKVVVVLIGSNNLGGGQQPKDVAAGVEKIVRELGAQLPETKVLLLGVLPRGWRATDRFRPQIAELNRRIADLDDGGRVTYLDIGAGFLAPDGSISPDVMFDGAHPSLWGYQIYTSAVWDTLTGLLEP